MSPAVLTLLWFICVCAVTFGVYMYLIVNQPNEKEGFDARRADQIRITTCPNGTISYINSAGDTNCCDSELRGGKCPGTSVCTLSPARDNSAIKTCSNIMAVLWGKRSYEWCPRNWYYYGTIDLFWPNTGDANIWGCSTVPSKMNGSRPDIATGVDFCTIYGTDDDNLSKITTAAVAATGTTPAKPATVVSCKNLREMARIEKPTPTATVTMINTSSSARKTPALFNVTFTPVKNGSSVPVLCTDWNRFKLFLGKVFPKAIPMYEKIYGKHVYFCPAAKAYYVDGTLSASNAMGVPSGNALPGICPPTSTTPPK